MRDTIPSDRIDSMVQRIRPNWTVTEATSATSGYHLVEHLLVETSTGQRRCVLKATPSDHDPVCDDEARLLALLDGCAEVAIPEVYGVVDEDETLPAPFFLAEEVPGRNYRRAETDSLPTRTLERTAHSLGRQLAAAHDASRSSDGVSLDGYSFVDVVHEDSLDGARPEISPEQVTVTDAVESWPSYLEESAEGALAALEDTRFSAMAAPVAESLQDRFETLTGPFEPALCRVDHSIENAVFDGETHDVSALLDWEFCVAATPAYDLAFAVDSFSGGLRALLPGVDVERDRVETALLEGYQAAGQERVLDRYRENAACYRLLSDLHAMCNFESWFDRAEATDAQREATADPLRERVRSRC